MRHYEFLCGALKLGKVLCDMAENIQIGKYTLESLTTGMYSDPKIIYREYIQNSVDSLEIAVRSYIIKPEDMRIDILIDPENAHLSIRDNGTGINSTNALPSLMNIGSSQKRHSSSRGFRGIGRLGGMSYCGRLVFTTSAINEGIKTIVEFDCKKLRQLLVPGAHEHMDLTSVLHSVTQVRQESEEKDLHYFLVELFDVGGFSDLLNPEAVKSYISQVSPIPYDYKFYYAPDLRRFLHENGYELEEFPIYVGETKERLEAIRKPNRCRFHADRKKKKPDEILSLKTFRVEIDGELYALGWYGACSWFGSLCEGELSGIRVRKGNILIGDHRTLNAIFKEGRFNGWTQGELFVVTDRLIPNARRDDFEQSEACRRFMETLRDGIGAEITRTIREASSSRNDPSAKVIAEVQRKVSKATDALEKGFNSSVDKERMLKLLEEAEDALINSKIREDLKPRKTELQQHLAQTIETVRASDNYKLKRIHTGIDRKSKRVLATVSDILSKKLSKELVDQILEEIIATLNGKRA